jgi:hypothetical protein
MTTATKAERRQHQAGSPIVVVKPFQTKRHTEESTTT